MDVIIRVRPKNTNLVMKTKPKPDWRLDFKPNTGPTQRALRIITGIGLLALAASGLFNTFWVAILVFAAVFQFVEAAARY